MRNKPIVEEHLTTHEAAQYFHVTPTTVIQWEKKGFIECVITPGGHRRFPMSEIEKLLKTFKKTKIKNIKEAVAQDV